MMKDHLYQLIQYWKLKYGLEHPHTREEVIPCPNCESPMVERTGQWGSFLGCSAFPRCKTTKKIIK